MRLTCKQKVDREQKGSELPSGIVKWFVEVFDAEPDEDQEPLVAIATILTMVQKKQTVFEVISEEFIQNSLSKLTEDAKPKWGIMTPQHMVEHLEWSYKVASGEIQDFEIATPEEHLEKVHDSLYNYKPFPQGHHMPLMKKDELMPLEHDNLDDAKQALLDAREAYVKYFKQNAKATTKNAVFGHLDRFEWTLLERKHLNHHFKQFNLID